MTAVKSSKRESATDIVSDFISFNNLARVYGDTGLSEDKKYRYVLFSLPRTLDGEVRIYNPNFVAVQYQTAFRDLPHRDWRVYKSVDEATEFLRLAFVEFDTDKALEIPTFKKGKK